MVSTILKRSIAFSITAWLLVAVGVGDYSLHNFSRADNYIIAGIIIAPFALTLIMGAIHCFPKKSDYLEKESVPYILFRFSFQRNFDTFCCLAFYVLAFLFALRFDSKFITYGTVYIIACFFIIISADDHSSSVDPNVIESERISVVKVFLLSLALTPIAGYIAVRMYKAEQTQKTDTMKLHLERAKAYIEAKDFTNAILECQEGLNGTGEFVGKLREGNFDQREVRYDILRVLAEIYCEQGKYSEAIESYHKAMFIFPHNPYKAWECVHSIVDSKWVYEDRGATIDAQRVLESCEELFPNEERLAEARTQLTQHKAMDDEALSLAHNAEAHKDKGDYASAIADYTKAIELALKGSYLSTKSYCYGMRAHVYYRQRDYVNAIADYTKALKYVLEDPENDGFFKKADLYGDRADVYLAQKDYTNAIADYTQAIEFAPKDDSFFNKNYFYDKRAEVYLEQAEVYLEKKDYANAIADCTKAIELASEEASILDQCYGKRARVYLEQKDYANAIADYTKAIELASEKASIPYHYYGGRARVYLEQKDYTNAIADYTKAIELAPEKTVFIFDGKSYYYGVRAEVYLMLKEYEKATADFTKALEFASEKVSILFYVRRARVYLAQKDYANAISDCTKVIELSPESAFYYSDRAGVYLAQKDYEKATTDCNKAIEINSQCSKAHEVLADVYAAQEKFSEAVASYTTAIGVLDSDETEEQAEIYKKRGEAHQKLGDMEQAEADFAKAKEIEAQE